MNIKKLRKEHPKLLNYLTEKKYCEVYICYVRGVLKRLFDNEGNYDSYEEFFSKFVCKEGVYDQSTKTKNWRVAFRMVASFDEEGRFPDKTKSSKLFRKQQCYDKLLPCFKVVIDNYKTYAATMEKRPSSITKEVISGAKFLICMQERGATSLEKITEQDILSFFWDGEKQIRGYSYKNSVMAVLKGNLLNDSWRECRRILNCLPPVRDVKKNFPFLTDEETATICKEISENDKITLRDKAIMSMLMYTGIRGVDIANFKMSNIDWRADIIHLAQSKTNEPLSLPLRATLGNAILEYIDKERPDIEGVDLIFINKANNSKPLEIQSVGNIVSRVFDKIGVRKDKGQNGVRLFRHNLATTMLREGVATRVISEILGHVSPLSLNPYIDADIEHLRECGLSIEDFPVRKEVFE